VSGFDIDQALMEQAARLFLKAAKEMVDDNPHPAGRTLRLTVEVIGGDAFGHVDIDVTNLWAFAQYAARRTGRPATIRQADPAPTSKPTLRLVQGEAR
jgi:hypothetical protein